MTEGTCYFLNEGSGNFKHNQLKDDQLMFVVREPFQSKKTQTGIIIGLLNHQSNLTIEYYMPSNDVIFSDGIESDFLNFNSRSIVTIGTAREKAKIVTL